MNDDSLYRLFFKQMRKFSFFTGVFASVALFTFAGGFMTLLTDKAEIQALGRVYVFIMGFAQIPQDLAKVYNGTIRSAGYRNVPMTVSFVGIWCVRVPMSGDLRQAPSPGSVLYLGGHCPWTDRAYSDQHGYFPEKTSDRCDLRWAGRSPSGRKDLCIMIASQIPSPPVGGFFCQKNS